MERTSVFTLQERNIAFADNQVKKEKEVLETHCDIFPKRKTYAALLVNVPVNFIQGPVAEGQEPPHGLGRIATNTESLGYSCGILDAQRLNLSIKNILNQIKKANPDVVGLNPTCVNVKAAREIADGLQQMGIKYIVGGYFSTLDTEKALEIFWDSEGIVKGHGELALPEIVKFILAKRENDIGTIKGVYKPNANKPIGEYAEKISLPCLPILDQTKYFYKPIEETEDGKKEISLFETDGCPFECGFCSSPIISQRKYERPETEKIVDDIENALAMGANRIHFLDDLVFIKENDIYRFYNELVRRHLIGTFDWRGMGRANIITNWSNNALEILKKSGCYQLAFGVESGSPRILKMIKKSVSREQVLKAQRRLIQFGINTKGFFIFGFPSETVEEMQLTMDLALNMAAGGAREISAFEFHPYPGSALWSYLERTDPSVLEELNYIEYLHSNLEGRASDRMAKTSMWLPETTQIATIPSSEVRKYVMTTLDYFYKIANN